MTKLGLIYLFATATLGYSELVVPQRIELGAQSSAFVETGIEIRNNGAQSITIEHALADCDCITIRDLPMVVAAKSQSVIHFTAHPRNRTGHVEHRVLLTTADSQNYPIILSMDLYAVKNWHFQPEILNFGNFVRGEIREMIVKATPNDFASGRKIIGVRSDADWLEVKTTNEKDGTSLQVSVGPSVPQGEREALIELITDCPAEPMIKLPIHVSVKRTMEINPRIIFINSCTVEKAVDCSVKLTNWSGHGDPVFSIDGVITPAKIQRAGKETICIVQIAFVEAGMAKKTLYVSELIEQPNGKRGLRVVDDIPVIAKILN